MNARTVFVGTLGSVLLLHSAVSGQTFSSGSTGADGALDLSTCSTAVCEVQLPPNGVFNYTTVNIPVGKELRFRANAENTPVYLLAQGAVTIRGNITVESFGRTAGPGGFAGGPPNLNGGLGPNFPGFGPGAGPQSDGSRGGRWVGPLSLVPIVGGSGGSGGSQCTFVGQSPYGGGGGGAITIASSTSISFQQGVISARGGSPECPFGGAGYGAGGAIRMVANSIAASGSFVAYSGDRRAGFGGVVRLEAPSGALSFTGTSEPAAVLSAVNAAVLPTAAPLLSIISVGGVTVPAQSGQRFDVADVLLPAQLPDPINVVVAAANIPVGTQVQLAFGTNNAGTVAPGTLTGTLASSSTTVQVSGLNRSQLAYFFVSATFAVPQSTSLLNPSGPDQVAQVRIAITPGGSPQLEFLRADGSRVDRSKLRPEFVSYFSR